MTLPGGVDRGLCLPLGKACRERGPEQDEPREVGGQAPSKARLAAQYRTLLRRPSGARATTRPSASSRRRPSSLVTRRTRRAGLPRADRSSNGKSQAVSSAGDVSRGEFSQT
jgi:hypothetical protein